MHGGVFDHVVGEVAGSIFATSVGDRMADEVEIFLEVDIEWWNCPGAFGVLGFLFHIEDSVVFVENYDSGALEFLDGRLLMTHDARGVLFFCECNKVFEGEEEEVVGGDDEEIRRPS